MKRTLTRPWSFSNLVSLLQKHLFTYARSTDFFDNVEGFARDFVKNRGAQEEFQGKLDFSEP